MVDEKLHHGLVAFRGGLHERRVHTSAAHVVKHAPLTGSNDAPGAHDPWDPHNESIMKNPDPAVTMQRSGSSG